MAAAVGAEAAAQKLVEKIAAHGGKVVKPVAKDGRRPATPGFVGNTTRPSVKKISPRAPSPDSNGPAKNLEGSKPKLTTEELLVAEMEAKRREVKEMLERNARRVERTRAVNSKSGVEEQTRATSPTPAPVVAPAPAAPAPAAPAPAPRQASPRPRSRPAQEKPQPMTRPASPGRQPAKAQAKPALTRPTSVSRRRPASPQVASAPPTRSASAKTLGAPAVVRKLAPALHSAKVEPPALTPLALAKASEGQEKMQPASACSELNESAISSAGSESNVEKVAQGVASGFEDARSHISEHQEVCVAASQAEVAPASAEEEDENASDDRPLSSDDKETPRRKTPGSEHKRKEVTAVSPGVKLSSEQLEMQHVEVKRREVKERMARNSRRVQLSPRKPADVEEDVAKKEKLGTEALQIAEADAKRLEVKEMMERNARRVVAQSPTRSTPALVEEGSARKLGTEDLMLAEAEVKRREVKELREKNARRVAQSPTRSSPAPVEEGSARKMGTDDLMLAEADAKRREVKEQMERNARRVAPSPAKCKTTLAEADSLKKEKVGTEDLLLVEADAKRREVKEMMEKNARRVERARASPCEGRTSEIPFIPSIPIQGANLLNALEQTAAVEETIESIKLSEASEGTAAAHEQGVMAAGTKAYVSEMVTKALVRSDSEQEE